MAVDPVCKMEVDEKSATEHAMYKSEKFYFCCAGCREEFQRHPEKYLGRPAQ
jgi:YHS domain-containing protein